MYILVQHIVLDTVNENRYTGPSRYVIHLPGFGTIVFLLLSTPVSHMCPEQADFLAQGTRPCTSRICNVSPAMTTLLVGATKTFF